MRVLFINPPYKFKISRSSRWPEYTKSGTFYYPLWLSYAASYVESAGHEIMLIDAIAADMDYQKTYEKIKEFRPGLIVIDSSTPTITNDIKFVEFLRERSKNVKIMLVGTHPSALPAETLKASPAIDFVAIHEYDDTIKEIANRMDEKMDPAKVLGIAYRIDKKIIINKERPLMTNLDEIPFVTKIYERFLRLEDYRYSLARHPMIQILSSRGCPNRCVFCLYPQTLMMRTFRPRSAENFVDELEYISKNHPEVKEIFIEDDTFTTDKERIVKICDLIEERNLNVVWSANSRADVPYDVLRKMRNAGCRMLIVGYESGNQIILNNIKKGITLDMSEEFTKNCKKLRIKIFGCFMIGLPGETKETIMQTFEFAKKLSPDMVFFQHAVPFPGTEFYNWCKQNGYLKTEDYGKWLDKEGRLDYLVDYPDLKSDELREMRDKLMVKYYTSPKQLLQTISKNLHPYEMARTGKAAFDYLKYLRGKKK